MLVGGADVVAAALEDLAQGVVFHHPPEDDAHIPRGGPVVFRRVVVVEAGGVGKGGVGAPQLRRPAVHQVGKVPHAAVANVVPQHHGRLVGGLEQHGVKKPPHRDLLPLEDAPQVGAAVDQVLDVQLQGDLLLVQVQPLLLHVFHRHQGGHQLGQIPGLLVAFCRLKIRKGL